MNILISSASYIFTDHVPGGEYQIVHAIISRLAKRGHHVYVITPKVDLKQEIPNVTVYAIGGFDFRRYDSYWGIKWGWWHFSYLAYRTARKIINRYPIDIIHHIRPASPLKFSLCTRLGVPFVYGPVSLPAEPSLPTEASARFSPPSGFIEILKTKLVDRLDMALGTYFWQQTMQKAAHVSVSVPKTLDFLPEICRYKSALIPLGVDTDQFSPALVPSPGKHLQILFAGSLITAKGISYLLRAFSSIADRYPEVRLTLAGDGPQREIFENEAKSLCIENRTEFLKSVPFDQMAQLYQRCDIFCLPTLTEAFGLSLLQAMASGKPVVASCVGGIPSFVIHDRNGLLVPPADPERLAQALSKLLSDATLRQHMGQINRETCLKKYRWDTIVDQIESIYQTTANPNP